LSIEMIGLVRKHKANGDEALLTQGAEARGRKGRRQPVSRGAMPCQGSLKRRS